MKRKNSDNAVDNVITNSAEFGLIPQRDFFDKDIAIEGHTSNYTVIQKGDFVYNPRKSTTAPYGPFNCYMLEEQGIVSPLYTCLSLTTNDYTEYLLWYFKTENWHTYIQLNGAQGGARHDRVGMTNELMNGIPVALPSYEEQKAIASFLSALDRAITLHQRKLDQMKEYKKGMLQKMFPKAGETVPEIRFPGFTDAWEQRKFGELYKKSSEKNDGSIGIDKNITVATMQYKEDVTVSTEDYLKTYYTFNLGDIAFEGHQSKEFRFGRFVENDIGNGIVSHIFAVFRPIVEYDLHFWKYAINNERLMQRVLSRSTKASTMMHDLVSEDFLAESFLVPALEEQKAIGAFLTKLDSFITLHQRKLDQMKEYKKGLLQQMFV